MGIPVLKDIAGYEGLYSISESGEVYSHINNKFLKHNISKNGYATVQLFKNKIGKRLLVHRLVAKTFIPNVQNLPQINHIDENKLNNNVSNLEWCTPKYNMNYGIGSKTRHSKIDYSKEIYKINAVKNGKKVSKSVIQIKNNKIIAKFESAKEASLITKSSHSHICECCLGKRKSTNGFEWKYERGNDLSVFQS